MVLNMILRQQELHHIILLHYSVATSTVSDYTAWKAVLTSTGTGAGVSTIKLWFNTTNIVATINISAAAAMTLYDMGTLSNLSSTETIWEIQLQSSANNRETRIAAMMVEF